MNGERVTIGFCVAVLLAAIAAAGPEMPQAVTDSTITARVETALLFDEQLNPLNINATTSNGVVTLTGSVRYPDQKELAENLAKAVPGVERVENNIIVIPQAEAYRKRTWRQLMIDKAVAANVKARLGYHKQLQGLQVGVHTRQNVVTLYGVVGTEEQKAKMGDIAMETRGVERVINNLTINPKEELAPIPHIQRQVTDGFVETRVETAILLNRHVSINDLNVEVNEGLCLLTGVVQQPEQRELAESIAMSTQGVSRIQNDIQVVPGAAVPPDEDLDVLGEPVDLSPLDPDEVYTEEPSEEPGHVSVPGDEETDEPVELQPIEPIEVEELDPLL